MTGRLTRLQRKQLEEKTHKKIDLDKLPTIDVAQLVSEAKQVDTQEEKKEKKQKREKNQKGEKKQKEEDKQAEEPVKEQVDEPVKEQVEEPVKEPVEEPFEEPVEERVEEQVQQQVKKQDNRKVRFDDEASLSSAHEDIIDDNNSSLSSEQEDDMDDDSSLSSEQENSDSDDDDDDSSVLSEEEDSSEDEDVDLDALLNKAQEALASKAANIQLEDKSEMEKIKARLSKIDTGISINDELYFKKVNGRAKLVPEAVALVDEGEKAPKKASVVLKADKDQEKHLTKKERLAEREKTTGKAWFDMPKTEMTPEVKRDLDVLRMRHILDRKRHYKKMGKRPDPKYFQIGTIIESPTEFFSARINKKDRKQTIVDELMASDELKQYYKRKYSEVQERTNSGGKKHYKKLKAQRQSAK